MEGTSGNERFYVMALENFDSNSYYWYYNSSFNLDSSYNVSGTDNDFAVAGAEPTGRINTERMIASWNSSQYGEQNSNDMWGLIQDEVSDGWFVPSKSEWSAFGAAFEITSSNYSSTYGLSASYWSSSQYDANNAYNAGLQHRQHLHQQCVPLRLCSSCHDFLIFVKKLEQNYTLCQ